jgi:hypothetical protein
MKLDQHLLDVGQDVVVPLPRQLRDLADDLQVERRAEGRPRDTVRLSDGLGSDVVMPTTTARVPPDLRRTPRHL